jgi:hypothetical protein
LAMERSESQRRDIGHADVDAVEALRRHRCR